MRIYLKIRCILTGRPFGPFQQPFLARVKNEITWKNKTDSKLLGEIK